MNNAPDLTALLSADNIKYGAYPNGIPEGTPFTEFLGKQWGSLSKQKEIVECWSGAKTIPGNNKLPIYLDRAQTKLFTFE
jgi:hypothetical protein